MVDREATLSSAPDTGSDPSSLPPPLSLGDLSSAHCHTTHPPAQTTTCALAGRQPQDALDTTQHILHSGVESALPLQPGASTASSASSLPTTTSTRVTRSSHTFTDTILHTGEQAGLATDAAEPRTTRSAYKANTQIQEASVISERLSDTKGKKRAAPDSPSSEPEDTSSASISAASSKRPRSSISTSEPTSSYSLRSRNVSGKATMPRKTKSSPTKGKGSVKAKAAEAASSSRLSDSDVEMIEDEYTHDDQCVDPDIDPPAVPTAPTTAPDDEPTGTTSANDAMDDDEGNGENNEGIDKSSSPQDGGAPSSDGPMDEAAAMAAIFGSEFRQFSSYMLGMSSRLKSLLTSIKPSADPTTRLLALQELSELLSMSTEDTLSGFPMDGYIRELVKILGGSGKGEDDDDDDEEEDKEMDEDAQLAAALAMSGGGSMYSGDENPEAQVLACRCLANLMEALPGVAHTIVYHGAVPVLCSKLIEITYIDLAEQTLSTLEKISEEFPSAIVREGGLGALLNYLDFFSIAVQRTALQAAANCCRNISSEQFGPLQSVWPILRSCLSYGDSRLVEHTCSCIIRVVESYHRSYVPHLEVLIDELLVAALKPLLLPAGGSPLVSAHTTTNLLRALATAARSSPRIALALLEADVADVLYGLLTGVLPPAAAAAHEEEGGGAHGQGLGGGLADMTVMENLAHRPKDQVEEVLSLASELMPVLPRDGVFDHKSYSEKALSRLIKAKAKAEKAEKVAAKGNVTPAIVEDNSVIETPSSSQAESVPGTDESVGPSSQTPTGEVKEAAAVESEQPTVSPSSSASTSVDSAAARTELLRSKPAVVGRFMMLMVPVLVDVYAASVIASVRIKALTAILKAVSFLDGDGLSQVLRCVPMASFASSILSSKDHPGLVLSMLQLVEMLLAKLPADYKPAFRREGVVFELQALAARPIASKDKDKDKSADNDKEKESGVDGERPTSPAAAAASHAIFSAAIGQSIPGYRKLASMSIDPEDAITLRARIILFRHLSETADNSGDGDLGMLVAIANGLSNRSADEKDLGYSLESLTTCFAKGESATSSFELLQSGAVDALMAFATAKDYVVDVSRRQQLIYETFSVRDQGHSSEQTPLAILVKKLQEALTKMESYDVVTVTQGLDDSKRSSPSLLARQLRLRLIADEASDIPKNLSNIVVSIHAIATFQALHDYLRPRVSGVLLGGSRISNMLAALAAAGARDTPSGAASSSRAPLPGVDLFSGAPSKLSPEANPPALPTAATSAPVPAAASDPPPPTRRRSQRLRAKKSGGSITAEPPAAQDEDSPMVGVSAPLPDSSETLATAEPAEAPIASTSRAPALDGISDHHAEGHHGGHVYDDEEDFSDDDFDAEVLEEVEDPDLGERTVSVKVADDGSKVEAQTPDGTRVATPNPHNILRSAKGVTGQGLAGKASYAAALKAKPTDWHLQFEMDDSPLPLDLTIYGAIHQHQMRKTGSGSIAPHMIWQGVHTINFKKVTGPAPSAETREDTSKSRSASPSLSSLPDDAPHSKILRLLRVLHRLNLADAEHRHGQATLGEAAFVNNKLTAKLTRQLEEPMIVASSCLPDWALDLPQNFPFLFPFATRYHFLQSTSFGYARLILRWQSQQGRQPQESNRRDDNIGFLGRLQRQKVRISRKHILESAIKVFEMYGSSSSVLEVEYFEEVGTGLGPTLEFYSLASREFARKSLKLWRDDDASDGGLYVFHPHGLFPAPSDPAETSSEAKQRRIHLFRVIGQFLAKAMLDSRIIDMSFNKVFLKLALANDMPVSIDTLKLVDPSLAASLSKLASITSTKPEDGMPSVNIADLALDFTLPGYDIELRPGGRDLTVTADNVFEYISETLNAILGSGIQDQVKAFREGFSKVFSINDLKTFTPSELVMLFGNTDEDWSTETLSEALKADHGFNVESRAIRDLIEIMSEYDVPSRRGYLQFITGSPKLPIGGFRGLNPALTVVRKPHEAPLSADDYLPSVMTCVNYLKLPEYSSKAVMREKLRVAMKEGVGSFHLS